MSDNTMVKEYKVIKINRGVEIWLEGILLIKHTEDRPAFFAGTGIETMEMYRGNFDINDYVESRVPLELQFVDSAQVKLSYKQTILTVAITKKEEALALTFHLDGNVWNRFWLRLEAQPAEMVFGCGEQFSYLNLRGKNFPLWTSEPGVGRNKNTYTTWQADVKDKAGGDYYTTNFPLPTFISSRKYYCHVETTAYADFNFRHDNFHELEIWEVPSEIVFESGESYKELARKLSNRFGNQPELPDWTYNGIWLGLQGGTEVVEKKVERALKKGLKIGAIWTQDWQGKRFTSFGKRLMWNWRWNEEEYPALNEKVWEWKEKGIRLLGYINPYVAVDGDLYQEANKMNYLATKEDGSDYLVDFGEFDCGVVDFTNPDAAEWYKRVIQTNLIDFGLDGWMADFGEYLPTDVSLFSGKPAKLAHNEWPTLWAKVNHDTVCEAGRKGDIVYFMRAGYTGTQGYCPLLWAGDQSVDWSIDDGLASTIPAALSAGMTGSGISHSDIGGYTSLHGNKRSKELLLRWVDMAAFTPVMRTHEGNRPDDCFQFDDDEETLLHFVRMTNIYVALAPYMKACVSENARHGVPVQRPLFMEFETDEKSYDQPYQYMLGADLLVAPVHQQGVTEWDVYLPEEEWVHFWSGQEYTGGVSYSVQAPIGEPPVFYRKSSSFRSLFDTFIG